MPTRDAILAGLTALANDWRGLAVAWHIVFATAIVAVVAGWRPRRRRLGALLIAPIVSVAMLAWESDNAFNGTVFAVLAVTLATAAIQPPNMSLRFASSERVAAGILLIAFGLTYPHFLDARSWTAYLYAAPFGLLPCPTLSVAIGATLAVASFNRVWAGALAAAGLWYGLFGMFALDVGIDVVLLAASAALAFISVHGTRVWRSVRANRVERTRPLPGDEIIPAPFESMTHALTIPGSPAAVWPWLAQMGAGTRAGWYSYDVLDNRGHRSAMQIVPELQEISVGTVFPALPGTKEGFTVLAFEARRSLVLGFPGPDGRPLTTWSFLLEPRGANATRLIVRARGGEAYRFNGLPPWLSAPIIRVVHFVMQRRQLLGLARRVEMSDEIAPSLAAPAPEQRRSA